MYKKNIYVYCDRRATNVDESTIVDIGWVRCMYCIDNFVKYYDFLRHLHSLYTC
jgi:hypothetical protein